MIQMDHHALTWLDSMKEKNARLTWWSLSLQPYQFTVHFRLGKGNGNADALSRADFEQASTERPTSWIPEGRGGV